MARNVGATFMVARETGDEILRCAQNDRTGGRDLRGTGDGRSRAPPLRFYMSAEGDAARRITKGFMARNVGATFMVARETGDEILRCAQNDRTGDATCGGRGIDSSLRSE
jgi:hypothetical protein